MDESIAAQYAIQIAVHTLKDRCRNLQQRIAELEEENVNLRISNADTEMNHSVTELGLLKQQIVELSEQKEQLQNKIKLVTNENQDLWNKLGKLTQVNKNLGSQLSKINDTLSNHTSSSTALVRSKTFTQTEPKTKILQKNLEENDKISLELENISLKLIDSFSKEKQELDALCSEIKDMQQCDNIITENFAFNYEDDFDNDLLNEFYMVIEDLKVLREETELQQKILRRNIERINDFKPEVKVEICDKTTSTEDVCKQSEIEVNRTQNYDDKPSYQSSSLTDVDKICPICSRTFYKNASFEQFQQHVEEHFTSDTFELL